MEESASLEETSTIGSDAVDAKRKRCVFAMLRPVNEEKALQVVKARARSVILSCMLLENKQRLHFNATVVRSQRKVSTEPDRCDRLHTLYTLHYLVATGRLRVRVPSHTWYSTSYCRLCAVTTNSRSTNTCTDVLDPSAGTSSAYYYKYGVYQIK